LFAHLLAEVQKLRGVTVYGLTDPDQLGERCPTLAFTKKGANPQEIAAYLGEQGIFVWDGNYYALSVTEHLGVEDSGGMVRVGLAHYNTREEIDRLLTALREME
jgi:selenocysteine lyase/cysteine desulfurase